MDISLTDIKAFREVVRTGTVSAASRALGLTQPTLSWTIKKLERLLGHELFERTNKGLSLTASGKIFHSRSERLLVEFVALEEELSDLSTEVSGIYTIGVYATMASFTLPFFCGELLRKYPHLHLKLVHDLSRHISEGVIQGHIDFGLVVNPPQYPDLTLVELYRDEIKFWYNPSRLALEADPSNLVLIGNPDLLQTEILFREAARTGLFQSHRTLFTTDLMLIRALVMEGVGVGLLPQTIAQQGSEVLQAVDNTPVHPDSICLIYRNQVRRTKAGQVIKDAIEAACRFTDPIGEVPSSRQPGEA